MISWPETPADLFSKNPTIFGRVPIAALQVRRSGSMNVGYLSPARFIVEY